MLPSAEQLHAAIYVASKEPLRRLEQLPLGEAMLLRLPRDEVACGRFAALLHLLFERVPATARLPADAPVVTGFYPVALLQLADGEIALHLIWPESMRPTDQELLEAIGIVTTRMDGGGAPR